METHQTPKVPLSTKLCSTCVLFHLLEFFMLLLLFGSVVKNFEAKGEVEKNSKE
jgi:hypothetical protein